MCEGDDQGEGEKQLQALLVLGVEPLVRLDSGDLAGGEEILTVALGRFLIKLFRTEKRMFMWCETPLITCSVWPSILY